MFGCYRKTDANDAEVLAAAVASTLANYPMHVIEYVTDPRTGLPSKSQWIPSVFEVREACEAIVGPQRRAKERQEAFKKQMEEREAQVALEAERPNRKTYDELQAYFAEAGFHFGPRPRVKADPEATRKALGLSPADWDAIPNAPASSPIAKP